LKSVHWTTLAENATQWFGVSLDNKDSSESANEGLINAIEETLNILLLAGDFTQSPLPDNNPYRITQNSFIAELFSKGSQVGFKNGDSGADQDNTRQAVANHSLTQRFPVMEAAGWEQLREIGTLQIHPIAFQSGTESLSEEGKSELDNAVKQLAHYPNFRIVVKGHSGIKGDAEANKTLSQARSAAVAQYLTATFGVDTDRLRAIGYGADQPLPRKPGESDRAYNYRLPRVELYLVAEDL
jgi:outer membrane protein OmpA-like peptidoglycan-associated protein